MISWTMAGLTSGVVRNLRIFGPLAWA